MKIDHINETNSYTITVTPGEYNTVRHSLRHTKETYPPGSLRQASEHLWRKMVENFRIGAAK